ncbi:MAG TPA: D-2-hydroxyacid dehydrogenase [Aggregatilineales bacterium]|nr:D-2-hydroxyacid dehydrogenase [Aggregatilineales bacterium]
MTNPKVLIASYLEPELIEHIRSEVPDVEVIYRPDLLGKPTYIAEHTASIQRTPEQEAKWRALLAEAEILFDFDFTHRADLPERAPKLRWIQATSAGIGQFVKNSGYAQRTSWIFTTASGVHARPLAEFVVMSMLMFAKDAFYMQREQAAQHWQRYCGFELAGKTLVVVGLGKVGQEVARLAKAFDMRVVGTRHSPANGAVAQVDAVYGPEALPELLGQADFLTLCVPHTPETEKLIGAKELAALPRGAFLINIARGVVVDKSALVEALRSGQLGGAALDVTDPEPLPPGDPLWTLPNVLISPHSASTAVSENRKVVDLFCQNLKLYLKKQPLINQLDTVRLY